jgi:sugar phosphate isomerase/epimerase
VEGRVARPLGFIAALDFASWSAADVAAALTGLGYDGVEWTMDHLDVLAPPALALACQQDLVTRGEQAVADTFQALECAHDAQVPVVNLLTGPNLWEAGAVRRDDEAAWATALSALERIVERAGALGVAVALEPCWGTLAHDAATARRALDAVPVGVVMDPSHLAVAGDDIPALVREWGPRIAHVHLKDAFGRPGMEGEDFHFCLLGEGTVPWPETFAALDEIGYAGALSIEFESYRYYEQVLGSDPVAAARLALEQARALLRAAA